MSGLALILTIVGSLLLIAGIVVGIVFAVRRSSPALTAVIAAVPATLHGRYIRIDGKANEYINLAELKVLNTAGENIAIGKTVTASSAYDATAYPITRLNNGVATDYMHTNNGPAEWVELDLGSDTPFTTIKIINRTDCCKERIDGARLSVFDGTKKLLFSAPISGAHGDYVYTITEMTKA